jgi:hypothetical protein
MMALEGGACAFLKTRTLKSWIAAAICGALSTIDHRVMHELLQQGIYDGVIRQASPQEVREWTRPLQTWLLEPLN